MTCEQCREAVSARLDGEESPGERAATDSHLGTCAACRRWYEDAARITRLARIGLAAPPAAGPPETVLRMAPGPGRARLVRLLRVALGVFGAAQVLIAVGQVAAAGMRAMGSGAADVQGATAAHLLHESAAWNLAIGAGFLFIAWRRTRPAGLVPVLTAFVGALTLLSVDDVISGMVAAGRLASHVLVLAGYAIVVALSRPSMRLDDPPAGSGRYRTARVPEPDDESPDGTRAAA